MDWAPRHSIATRLTLMNMLVSAVALVLACAGFFVYDQITFRDNLVRTLSAQAQIIGSNTVSAILFNDPQAAANTLAALKSSQNIASAGIFTNDHRELAEYLQNPGEGILNIPPIPAGEDEVHWFRSTHLVLVRRITSEGKPIGFVYLRADLREIDQRLRRYALISFLVLMLSLVAAVLVSSVFRRSVAKPIVDLAATAQTISRDKDYSVRVTPVSGRDEISVLIDSFNVMLDELHKSHDELERRVAERTRELVAANRELEAFSYSVSHDLRGPLEAVDGFSYLLLNQYGERLDDKTRELSENIRAAAKRMGELIEALLNLSRITSGSMRPEPVDLGAMARSIMQDLQRTAPDRKVEFISPAKEDVYGDPQLLRIVMENLLRNSWKYTSRHQTATIEFGSLRQDGKIIYFVKDDGSGFDPRSADRLFQPFLRLHSKSEFPGNGVGLATVKRIIQRHGGEVWAQAAVERGATFFFTVRLDQREPAAAKN
jgi:signal transduction histidine kinase